MEIFCCLTGRELAYKYINTAREWRGTQNWDAWVRVQFEMIFGVAPPEDRSADYIHHMIAYQLQYLEYAFLGLAMSERFLKNREALLSGHPDMMDFNLRMLLEIREGNDAEEE